VFIRYTMPYVVRAVDEGYKACKKGTPKCFSKEPLPKSRAEAQQRALYASENRMEGGSYRFLDWDKLLKPGIQLAKRLAFGTSSEPVQITETLKKPLFPGKQDFEPLPGLPDSKILAQMANVAYDNHAPATIKNWKLMYETEYMKFYGDNNKNIIVAVRGTSPTDVIDLHADATLVTEIVSKLTTSTRFDENKRTLLDFQKQFPREVYAYIGVGHSLAGAILDLFLEQDLIKQAVSFNPAVQRKFYAAPNHRRIYSTDDFLFDLMGKYVRRNLEVRQGRTPLTTNQQTALGLRTTVSNVFSSLLGLRQGHSIGQFTGRGERMIGGSRYRSLTDAKRQVGGAFDFTSDFLGPAIEGIGSTIETIAGMAGPAGLPLAIAGDWAKTAGQNVTNYKDEDIAAQAKAMNEYNQGALDRLQYNIETKWKKVNPFLHVDIYDQIVIYWSPFTGQPTQKYYQKNATEMGEQMFEKEEKEYGYYDEEAANARYAAQEQDYRRKRFEQESQRETAKADYMAQRKKTYDEGMQKQKSQREQIREENPDLTEAEIDDIMKNMPKTGKGRSRGGGPIKRALKDKLKTDIAYGVSDALKGQFFKPAFEGYEDKETNQQILDAGYVTKEELNQQLLEAFRPSQQEIDKYFADKEEVLGVNQEKQSTRLEGNIQQAIELNISPIPELSESRKKGLENKLTNDIMDVVQTVSGRGKVMFDDLDTAKRMIGGGGGPSEMLCGGGACCANCAEGKKCVCKGGRAFVEDLKKVAKVALPTAAAFAIAAAAGQTAKQRERAAIQSSLRSLREHAAEGKRQVASEKHQRERQQQREADDKRREAEDRANAATKAQQQAQRAEARAQIEAQQRKATTEREAKEKKERITQRKAFLDRLNPQDRTFLAASQAVKELPYDIQRKILKEANVSQNMSPAIKQAEAVKKGQRVVENLKWNKRPGEDFRDVYKRVGHRKIFGTGMSGGYEY